MRDRMPRRQHGVDVILKEGLPGLRRWLSSACKVLAHARFADVDAQLEQFTVDPWRTPERILAAHLPNLFGHRETPRLAATNLTGPEEPKAFAMPANDDFWFDDEQQRSPIAPSFV